MTALAPLPQPTFRRARIRGEKGRRANSRTAFSLPGYRFVVDTEFLDVLEHLKRVFAEFPCEPEVAPAHTLSPAGRPDVELRVFAWGPGFVVDQVGSPPAYFPDRGSAADYVHLQASHAALALVDEDIALHAAGVSRDGAALLIAGPSGSGKSTLTLALLRRGCGYMSDEAIFLSRETGLARGFPRALGLIERISQVAGHSKILRPQPGSASAQPDVAPFADVTKRYHHPSVFGASVERRALAVNHIVVLQGPTSEGRARRRGSAGDVAVVAPLSPAEAIPILLRQVFARGPADAILDSLVCLVHDAKIFRLVAGDAERAADAMLDLARGRPAAGTPEPLDKPRPATGTPVSDDSAARDGT